MNNKCALMQEQKCMHDKQYQIYDSESSEQICTNCGEIVDIVDNSDLEQSITRIDMFSDSNLINSSISSKMNTYNRDFTGKPVKNAGDLHRMRLLDMRINKIKKTKTIVTGNNTITTLCSQLILPKYIGERALQIFLKIYNRNNGRGRKCVRAYAVAAVIYSCKVHKIMRDIEEYVNIVSQFESNDNWKKEISKTYKRIIHLLDLEVPRAPEVIDYINTIGISIGTGEKTIREAINLYNKIIEFNKIIYSGKALNVVAASLLFTASNTTNEKIDKNNLISVSKSTNITLTKRCEEINEVLKLMN